MTLRCVKEQAFMSNRITDDLIINVKILSGNFGELVGELVL